MATIEELEQQKAELEKQEDLKLVRQPCKRHGFTYSALKNHLGEGRKRGK